MADEMNVVEETTTEQTQETGKTPTTEELLAKISQLEVDASRTKTALDKALKEKGEITKQLRSKMSEDEQRADDEKKKAEYVASLERQIKLGQAKERYLAMGMDGETALKSATAELDGDMDALFGYINANKESAIKQARESWLAERPRVNAGNGNSTEITQEQFNKMSLVERSELYKTNPDEYRRLSGN